MTDLLHTPEVGKILRQPVETLRYWRHIGYGPPSFKLGRRVLYDRGDLEAWIAAERTAQSRPTPAVAI